MAINRRTNAYAAGLIACSAVFYAWPLVLVGVANDFRYVYWTIGGSSVAFLLLLKDVDFRLKRALERRELE